MSARTGNQLLVIGYGSTLRCDDAAGQKVAEAIAGMGLPDVDTMTCDLLTPELADPISKASRVVFVDAAVDADEVQLRPLSPSESSQIVAHAADPRTMLALARDVFGQAPRAWWLTIPVENLSLGENLSDLAKKGIGQAIEAILGLARSGC